MTTEISVMYGSEKVNSVSGHKMERTNEISPYSLVSCQNVCVMKCAEVNLLNLCKVKCVWQTLASGTLASGRRWTRTSEH